MTLLSTLTFDDQSLQFKHVAAIFTDLIVVLAYRLMCQKFSRVNSYRLNIDPWNGIESAHDLGTARVRGPLCGKSLSVCEPTPDMDLDRAENINYMGAV